MRHTGWSMGDSAVSNLTPRAVLRLLSKGASLGAPVEEVRRIVKGSSEPRLTAARVPTADLRRAYGVRLENARRDGRQVLGGESLLPLLDNSGFPELVVVISSSGSANAIMFLAPDVSEVVAAVVVTPDSSTRVAVG